jgi:dienelactone hydrolase
MSDRMLRLLFALLLVTTTTPVSGAEPPPRTVDVTARDGAALKATYYAAAGPGPGVLLLHMCNATRQSWDPVGRQLSAAGIHALALDYRGFGDSPGDRFNALPPPQRQTLVTDTWPGDMDAALAYLQSQPGVDNTRVGAGGGSCGVQQAVQLARRHPDVRSLVLLAGGTDRAGLEFLQRTRWLPVFTAAAADDQYDADAPQSMRWLAELSGNPRNRFAGFADGRHGTEIFGPHPELVKQIVEWYVDTLVTAPADPGAAVSSRTTPATEFWSALHGPGGVARAVQLFHDARRRDAKAFLFPEGVMNQVAYERLQAGDTKDAIELFKLIVEVYPASANAQDSLGDGYLAAGQNELALAAARRSLEMLATDRANDQLKEAIRQSAQQKIDKLSPAGKEAGPPE